MTFRAGSFAASTLVTWVLPAIASLPDLTMGSATGSPILADMDDGGRRSGFLREGDEGGEDGGWQ